MNDYPSQSPWGPHGPQVSVPSVMPNPTAPSATPDFGGWQAPSSSPASSSGGGGGFVGGSAGGTATFAPQSLGKWMLKLGVAGAALGALAGLGRALVLHLPAQAMGLEVARLAIAGASAGAGIAPAFKAASFIVRAALWLGLAVALWAVALAASGLFGTLTRLR